MAQVFDNLLTAVECQQLINSQYNLKKSIENHNNRHDKMDFQILLKNLPITDTIFKRLKAVYFGEDNTDLWEIYDSVRLVHYVPGQFKDIHRDTKYTDNKLRCKYTLIVYLNDDFEGGHTVGFPDFTERTRRDASTINIKSMIPEILESPNRITVEPKTGRAAMYDIDLIHMGEPITRGEKWLLIFKIMSP